jgi:radical SAM protein with 4Fe4S-binding SPASM domain
MRRHYSAPSLVDISVTNRCNLHCPFCYANSYTESPKHEELTLNDYQKLFFELNELNVLRISITGGEPFIREDIFKILSEFDKYNYAKIINTNGILINEYIAEKLTKYNIDRICVSLDGSSSKVHDKIRGSGTFNKVINTINLLKNKYNLPVSTLFTLNKYNVDDLINCIKLNEKLGLEYMAVMMVCPTGRASDGGILPTKEQWYPMLYTLSKMIKNNEINLIFKIVPPNEGKTWWQLFFPLEYYDRIDLLDYWPYNDISLKPNEKRDISCQAGIKACSIIHNGDVYGCDLMIGIKEFLAGNVKETNFLDIWNNSSVFNRLRTMKFEELNGKCKECPNYWCGGGCRSAAYNLTGDICGSDISCFYS